MASVPRTRPIVRQAVPLFWVRDLETSARFYVDRLGFTVAKEWVEDGRRRWCWLELGDAALMLQEFWTGGPHEDVPGGKTGLGVSIYFICDDAVALWRELVARGAPATRPFVGNGMWVTEVTDPDGYHLLFESESDAPEESTLPGGP
jgi:catechol 2,3-dioxygenase-like lactoylglutathione lyase family enzyme